MVHVEATHDVSLYVSSGMIQHAITGVAFSEIAKGGLPCGSWRYWLAVGAVLVPTLPVMVGSRQYLLRKHRERVASNALWGASDYVVVVVRRRCTVVLLWYGVFVMVCIATCVSLFVVCHTCASAIFVRVAHGLFSIVVQ